MSTYTAVAERDSGWWIVTVPELDVVTQARRIDQIEHMARDLIAVWLEVEPDSFDVTIDVRIPDEWREQVKAVRRAREVAQRAEADAAAEARTVARRLKASGLPVRDVGAVLGVSPQRVSQLLRS